MARVLAEEGWDLIPNAEPAEACASRVRRGLEAIVSTVGPRAVAFVHDAVIGELCRQANPQPPVRLRPQTTTLRDQASGHPRRQHAAAAQIQ